MMLNNEEIVRELYAAAEGSGKGIANNAASKMQQQLGLAGN
jgi:hypothetical protein